MNKRYNIYDVNQQTTDDLRALKSTAFLDETNGNLHYINNYGGLSSNGAMSVYEVELPSDYFHILNCICIYEIKKPFKCYQVGKICEIPATRLTADAYPQILDNYWNRPTYKRPYYYIHNINTNFVNPTNPYNSQNTEGTDLNTVKKLENEDQDANGAYIVTGSFQPEEQPHILLRTGNEESVRASIIEKAAQVRYGNSSKVRMEIRYGTNKTFELKKVFIDYLKTPQHIHLTQKQIDTIEDTSQILEFPDYVCQEILNELVHIIMEHISDPRIQTHPVVSQSIANPAQQQAPAVGG